MKKIISLLLFFPFLILTAQNKKAKADELFNDFKFNEAIPLYIDLEKTRHNREGYITQKLADSYFNLTDYQQASKWYGSLYTKKGGQIGESNIIKLVQSLKSSKDLDGADDIIRAYYEDSERLNMILTQKSIVDSLEEAADKYLIQNMPFNSKKSDFAPAYFMNQLVFTSSRDSIRSKRDLYAWNKQAYLDLYITDPEIREYIPQKFLNNLETTFHDGTMAYSRKSNNIYFTRNFLKKQQLDGNAQGISNMQILMGKVDKGTLFNEEKLDFNNDNYSCAHPAITNDGHYLYFTSNMPGGYGETDIYVVELSKDGCPFTPPMNLGPTINTPGREMFPYTDKDGMLYFSSDGHYGFGGLDVFVSEILSKSSYTLPENMGKPINSNMDDFSLIWNPDDKEGYFSSNRISGVGDDDIYKFTKVKPVDCLVYSGVVLNTSTGAPLYDANIELYNEKDGIVTFLKTDEKGFFELTLPCNNENELVFSKVGFSKKNLSVITEENVEAPSKSNTIYLTPYESLVEKDGENEKISVNPIYFDYDKWNITPRAEIELEKVLFAMKEFPKLKIKIESHTDSRGPDIYNIELSDNRAKFTRMYLISKGIDADRIESAHGYGEYRLKNDCADGVFCDEKKHFENRRSDFIVVVK